MNKISVVVLSYNRKGELKQTLNILSKQDYSDTELVVADNASTDGTREMLFNEFPYVKLCALERNIGVEGRRKGAEIATGDIVVMYDDDSAPGTTHDLSEIAVFFKKHHDAAAVCTRVHRSQYGYDETWRWESYAVGGNEHDGYEGLFIHGSGMAFRRDLLLETDIFGNGLFWGDEEWDAALNLISRGCRIFYLPFITTEHRVSLLNRNKAQYFRRVTRNHLLILLRYFPFIKFLEYSLKEIFYQSLLARRNIIPVLGGILDFIRMAPDWYRLRRSIPLDRRGYLGLVGRLRYPWPLAWYRQQVELRQYRKGSVV